MKSIGIKAAGFCLAVTLAAQMTIPINVQATQAVKDVIQPMGATAMLKSSMTDAEYIQTAKQAEGTLWGYTNLGIANVDNNLNIRETPDEGGKLVGKLPKDCAAEVLDTANGWAHIKSGDVEGYVSTEFLFMEMDARMKAKDIVQTVAVVHADALKVRQEPNTECEVLTQVALGEELEFVEEADGWVKILLDADEAYVSSEYVKIEEKLGTAVTLTQLLYGQGVSNTRVDLCEYAKEFVGNPYVWGGTSLTKGADCSGFVLSVFKNFGYKLSHSSRAQANEGKKINLSDIQPGDLIFYGNNRGNINHVAIYIGGGKVVHASSPKTGIRISNYKYRSPVKAVRVIKD